MALLVDTPSRGAIIAETVWMETYRVTIQTNNRTGRWEAVRHLGPWNIAERAAGHEQAASTDDDGRSCGGGSASRNVRVASGWSR